MLTLRGIPFVKKQRQAELRRQLKLGLEGLLLGGGAGEVAIEIQPRLANGDYDPGMLPGQVPQFPPGFRAMTIRPMGVEAGGTAQHAGKRLAQSLADQHRVETAGEAGAGDHAVLDTGVPGAAQHRFPVVVKTLAGEIDANIHEG